MKIFCVVFCVLLAIISATQSQGGDQVEIILISNLISGFKKVNIDGNYVFSQKLLEIFGEYFFNTLNNRPEILEVIKKAKKNFKERNVGVAFPNKFFRMNDGRNLVIFSGCTPHNCMGTENIIVYDYSDGKAFLLVENQKQNAIGIYGNPDQKIKDLLISHYMK